MSWLRRGRRKDDVDPVAWATGDAEEDTDGSAPQGDEGPAPLLPTGAPDHDADATMFKQPAEKPPGGGGQEGSGRSRTGPPTSRRGHPAGGSDPAPEPAPVTGGPPIAAGGRSGPWDVSEVGGTEGYVDLGGLRLPGRDGMELRLEVEEASGRVTAATVQIGPSAVQLQAFAAPRSEGIWDEIRAEIATSITRQGGTADEVPGPFGKELLARIPTRTPDGRTAHQPARFAGIDGPRWFLRAVFHGAAAYEADQAASLEAFLRDVVVVRGVDAMAPRELLALRLPDIDPGPEGPQDEGDGDDRPPLEPFRRGPEITEVR